MNDFSVKCFGTGSGWPCADRNHAAFLYRLGGASILIDCGEPLDRNYKASGQSYDLFDAIFISHLHADHMGGFFMLLQGCWLEGRRRPLPVYMPKGAVQPMRELLRAAFLSQEVLPFKLDLEPLRAGVMVQVEGRVCGECERTGAQTSRSARFRSAEPRRPGGLRSDAPSEQPETQQTRVTAFRTSHLDGFHARFPKLRGSGLDAHCFLLESGGRRIGHSADLGKPEDLEPLLAKPLDLLVCELAHFTPEELFSYLAGRDLKQAVFVHLARPFREDMARTRRLAARMLRDLPHTFARDGQEIRF